jgi:hypothetical protein
MLDRNQPYPSGQIIFNTMIDARFSMIRSIHLGERILLLFPNIVDNLLHHPSGLAELSTVLIQRFNLFRYVFCNKELHDSLSGLSIILFFSTNNSVNHHTSSRQASALVFSTSH